MDQTQKDQQEKVLLLADKRAWELWLAQYGATRLFDAFVANCQGARSVCQYCGQFIYLDIREGGGIPDWGAAYPDGALDYGCFNSPETSSEGTGGHMPIKLVRENQ